MADVSSRTQAQDDKRAHERMLSSVLNKVTRLEDRIERILDVLVVQGERLEEIMESIEELTVDADDSDDEAEAEILPRDQPALIRPGAPRAGPALSQPGSRRPSWDACCFSGDSRNDSE